MLQLHNIIIYSNISISALNSLIFFYWHSLC